MPFSKKPPTPVKKEKAKSQQGKGKVSKKAVTAKGLGKKAVTAKLQQGKGKGKVGDKGDKGMGKKELIARVKDDWGNYLIEVRINKLETIPMISYEQQTIEKFRENIRMRARDLRIKLPPNFELLACPRFGCMDQKLIACCDFSLKTMVIMKKPIVPVTAMVDHVWGLKSRLINVKVNKFDGFSLFIQEKDSIEAVKAKIQMRARDLQIQLLSSNFELMACPLSGCMDQKLIACRDFCLIFLSL
jgi:hypothetical protein